MRKACSRGVMNKLLDMAVLVGFLLLLFTAVTQGYMKPTWAAVAFVAMFGFIFLARVLGSNLIGTVMKLGFAALSLWVFAVTTGGGQWRALGGILVPALVLLVVLYGLYVMLLRPFVGKKGKRRE
jgi:hypothetical protein